MKINHQMDDFHYNATPYLGTAIKHRFPQGLNRQKAP